MTDCICFHCGEEIKGSIPCYAIINDVKEPMCCIGCQCVAELIASSKLEDYYKLRETGHLLTRPKPTSKEQTQEWLQFEKDIYENKHKQESITPFELSVYIDNMACGACAWLIEHNLKQNFSIHSVNVNLATRELFVSWHDDTIKPSEIFRNIHQLGYQIRLSGYEKSNNTQKHYRDQLKRLAVAGFGMMQVMTYSVSLYMGAFQDIEPIYVKFFELTSLIIATIVVFYSGKPFIVRAIFQFNNRNWGMDIPIAIAILSAYIASCFTLFRDLEGEIYFDSAVMFIFFISISRLIEANIRRRAQATNKQVLDLLPNSIQIKRDGVVLNTTPEKLKTRDCLPLSTNTIVAADGQLIGGLVWVDESVMTGEALPTCKRLHDTLLAGSKIVRGEGLLSVSRPSHHSALANIQKLVQKAQRLKPRFAQFTDVLARYFVTFVLTTACLVGLYWLVVDPNMAFKAVLATLVVSCPCALSLAIPSAFIANTQALLRRGILVRDIRALENLSGVKTLIFDKTGTLTSGHCTLTDVKTYTKLTAETCKRIAASLEQTQTHPLAFAFHRIKNVRVVSDTQTTDGQGVEGKVLGHHFRLGQPSWACYGNAVNYTSSNTSPDIMLSMNGLPVASFIVDDPLKSTAKYTMDWCTREGFQTVLLSGDCEERVTNTFNILSMDYKQARCSPEDKLSYLQSLRAQKIETAMIGDGVNDAPILSAADVSISMGKNSLVAQTYADFVLLNDRIESIPLLFLSAKKCMRIAKQNAGWAIAYNVVGIPLAASGLLTPWLAALGMSVSSLLVVLNAQRAGNLPKDTVAHLSDNTNSQFKLKKAYSV